MLIYHGGYCEIKNPIIKSEKFTKDFGNGFYCTSIKKQAERWAEKNIKATVTTFEYTMKQELYIMEFENMSDEWLDFVVDCRNGKKHSYDIVIGPMADDQIYAHINSYIAGIIPRDVFFRMASFQKITHQMAFCTEKSLKCIKFIESERVIIDE